MPYRSDVASLRAKIEELQAELAEQEARLRAYERGRRPGAWVVVALLIAGALLSLRVTPSHPIDGTSEESHWQAQRAAICEPDALGTSPAEQASVDR